MKKAASIAFQVRFDDRQPGASKRLFSLYRQLRRKRQLARFCREAFVEKAIRHLDGQGDSYRQLDSLIKSKGVGYILESIRQKEGPALPAGADAAASADSGLQRETDNGGETAEPLAQTSANSAEPVAAGTPAAAAAVTSEASGALAAAEASEPSAAAESDGTTIKKVDLEKLKGWL